MKGTFPFYIAGVVKLADTQDLKSCGRYARSGSSPDLRILRLLEVKKDFNTFSVLAFYNEVSRSTICAFSITQL